MGLESTIILYQLLHSETLFELVGSWQIVSEIPPQIVTILQLGVKISLQRWRSKFQTKKDQHQKYLLPLSSVPAHPIIPNNPTESESSPANIPKVSESSKLAKA